MQSWLFEHVGVECSNERDVGEMAGEREACKRPS